MKEKELQRVILSELSEEVNLRPLSGFKLNFSANPGFQKVYFSASCACETAALLSVEVSNDKTDKEILDAIPSLVERLMSQERSFRGMDCSMHGMMRRGFITGPQEEVGSPEENWSMPKEMSESEALESSVRFSERYVERGPYEFFPEKEVVQEVQRGLADNHRLEGYRYCPWMPLSGDPVEDRKKICPCERHHEDIERDGFCIWMFFVSEEFLRKYEAGEDFTQTIDEAVPLGTELFEDTGGKKAFNKRRRDKENDPDTR